MTVHENTRMVCMMMVSDYIDNGYVSETAKSYWEMLSYIANAYLINAIDKNTVDRYCYHLHIDFHRLMSAPKEYNQYYSVQP